MTLSETLIILRDRALQPSHEYASSDFLTGEMVAKHQIAPLIEQLCASLLKMDAVLEKVSRETVRDWRGCHGSHTQYSSMAFEATCPICGESEDGPGGQICHLVLTTIATEAREARTSAAARLAKLIDN